MESDEEEVKEQALGWGSAWMIVGKERGNADACEYSVTTVVEGWMEQCGLNGNAIEGLLPLCMPLTMNAIGHRITGRCAWEDELLLKARDQMK